MSDFSNYYDGQKNQTLEPIQAKKNQKVIITVLDEFVEEMPVKEGQKEPDSGGIQSWVLFLFLKFSHPAKKEKEIGAETLPFLGYEGKVLFLLF